MWEKEGLTIVKTEDLPTVLLPGNYSARNVIETILLLNSQTFGFHIPYRDMKDIAEDIYCKDPRLVQKAMAVTSALNAASSEKRNEKEEDKGPVQ